MNNQKFPLDMILTINNKEYRIAQYRLVHKPEYVYTLSHKNVDGTYESLSLDEDTLGELIKTPGTLGEEPKL